MNLTLFDEQRFKILYPSQGFMEKDTAKEFIQTFDGRYQILYPESVDEIDGKTFAKPTYAFFITGFGTPKLWNSLLKITEEPIHNLRIRLLIVCSGVEIPTTLESRGKRADYSLTEVREYLPAITEQEKLYKMTYGLTNKEMAKYKLPEKPKKFADYANKLKYLKENVATINQANAIKLLREDPTVALKILLTMYTETSNEYYHIVTGLTEIMYFGINPELIMFDIFLELRSC